MRRETEGKGQIGGGHVWKGGPNEREEVKEGSGTKKEKEMRTVQQGLSVPEFLRGRMTYKGRKGGNHKRTRGQGRPRGFSTEGNLVRLKAEGGRPVNPSGRR